VIGQTIGGRFLIEREIGAGGMGVVYRAKDLQTGALVAFKVLSDVTREAAGRFGREALLLAELKHPGIVRYVAHGQMDGHGGEAGPRYLVMEWVEGVPLDQRLSKTGLDLRESVSVVKQVSGALAEAHRLGVVHRDLKPSNILLRDGDIGHATVIDFGIARRVQESQKLTKTGQVVGSPGYLAPEQAQGGGIIDPRADVFALGCLLYECLTGRAAFSGEHLVALFVRLMVAEPDPVVMACPEVPPELEDLLDRVLAKDPDARPRDAGALCLELETLGDLPSGPRRPRTFEAVNTIVTDAPPAAGLTDVHTEPGGGRCMVLALGSEEWGGNLEHTMTNEQIAEIDSALQLEVNKLGAHLDSFIDGSLLGVLEGDQAPARAAKLALVLRDRNPDAPIVVAGGGASTLASLDNSLRALERDVLSGLFLVGDGAVTAARPAGAIRLDDLVAGALDNSFDVRRDAGGPYLIGAR
jgi:serine/threonine protein kinase